MRSTLLEREWALFEAGEYSRACEQVRARLESLAPADRRDAQRLLGLALHAEGRHPEALDWFRQAAEGSDLADDWCHLALAATLTGDDKLASAAFEQARFCHQVAHFGQHPGLYVHVFWYASVLSDKGEYAAARLLLDELAQAYRRLQRTDTIFLYAQGMPFLSSVLSLALQVFRARESYAEGTAWLEALAAGLDEPGQRQVGQAMHDLVQNDGAREKVG